MGYYTQFSLCTHIHKSQFTKKGWENIKKEYKEEHNYNLFEINDKNELWGHEEIKNWDNTAEKECKFIADNLIKKHKVIEVEAIGEEADDRWVIRIEDRKLYIDRSELKYIKSYTPIIISELE